ncbi:MAG TPA: hypothetical protein VF267_01880 [Gammaproteobacteria bacterium]
MKKRRAGFLFCVGLMWAPLVTVMSALTARLGIRPYGDSELAVHVSAAIGDLVNIGLASILLALTVVLSGMKGIRWRESLVAVLPSFIWSTVDFQAHFLWQDHAYLTAVLYLGMLLVVPFAVIRLVARFANGMIPAD